MTSSQIPSPSNFVRPFASGQNLSGVTIDNALSPTGQLSFVNGFGSAFSTPGSNGGRYVKRMEMNKLFNVSTNDVFRWKVGAINTFDATFAATIGGYPEGAVLEYYDGSYMRRVRSLVDNNLVNFLEVGVDFVNWTYADEKVETNDPFVMCEIADFDTIYEKPSSEATIDDPTMPLCQTLSVFKSKWDGIMYVTGGLNFTNGTYLSKTLNGYGTASTKIISDGGLVLIVFVGNTADSVAGKKIGVDSGYKILFGQGSTYKISSSTGGYLFYSPLEASSIQIQKNQYVSITLLAHNCSVSNSTIKVRISPTT